MAPITKPETVLKQAEGLISVGQTHAALQSLNEMFSSKRLRNFPITVLEPIMLRFIQLAVDLRKGRTAKEGLMQYKNLALHTSVPSIEVVIKRFIQLSEAKVQEAQEKANRAVALTDVDDLEASETPESILLGAVSGDQNKDRTDRALVTPWLKFLWETYRTALETLKNNSRLEVIYQQIAHQAFKFCLNHSRKVEFRRLCETLRLHLANVAKYSNQTHSINLSDPDTLQHHLDTRFAQLNTSVELELWQEAFRSVEDVHNLLTMAKKAPRPTMMANYYEKLAKIFLTSGSALFHAAAWGRYYAVVRMAGGKTDEELGKLAGLVLVSALAVPIGSEAIEGELEETKGKSARLTTLLGLTKTPTRASLLKDALSRNTLKLSAAPIRQLYEILEVTFHPLSICATIAPVLQTLGADPTYSPFLGSLHNVLLSRLFSQLSQVYSSVKISHVLDLVAPLNAGTSASAATAGEFPPVTYDHAHIEAFVMGCAQRGELRLRVDHSQGSITFSSEGFGSSSNSSASPSFSSTSLVRTRLSRLAAALSTSISYLTPPPAPLSKEDQQAAFKSLLAAANEERSRLALHRTLVSRRAELMAELAVRKEKEEASRKAEASRKEKEEETRKAAERARRQERERIEREMDALRAEEAKKLAQTLIDKGGLKVAADDIATMDSDKLLALQVEQLDKEKRDLNERLRIISRRIDHLERAFRKEEKALLSADYEAQQTNDVQAHEAHKVATLSLAKERHKDELEIKNRLVRMMDDYTKTRREIAGKREEQFEIKRDEAKRAMEAEKAKRRAAILKEREEERMREEEEERLEREQQEEEERKERERLAEEERLRTEEEAIMAKEEERLRLEKEKQMADRKAREEERARVAEEARLKMQREEEAEARRAKRTGTGLGPAAGQEDTKTGGAWRRTPRSETIPTTPPRSGSPAPRTPLTPSSRIQASGGAYKPPAARGEAGGSAFTRGGAPAAGSWRDREKAKEAAAAAGGGENPAAKPPAADPEAAQPPPAKAVWKPRALR